MDEQGRITFVSMQRIPVARRTTTRMVVPTAILEEEEPEEEGVQTADREPHTADHPNIEQPSPSTSSTLMIDTLMDLLRRAKAHDLVVIDLQRKRLPATYIRALLKATIGSRILRRIRLYKVGVADCHASMIAEVLKQNEQLVDLDLGKNELTNHGLYTIANQIGRSRLKRLVLAGQAFSGKALACLLTAVRNSSRMESLKLSKVSGFDEIACRALESLLMERNVPLCRLDLRNCSLNEECITILAKAIATSSPQNLVGLCLAENDLDDSHMRLLSRALRSNTTIGILDLQYNAKLTDASMNDLLECLRMDNHTLQKLKLRHCDSISNTLKEEMLDLLLMNAHGADLALRTKLAERRIVRELQEMPDLTETSYDDSTSSLFLEETDDDDDECVICFECHSSVIVLLPCGHRNCCPQCAIKLHTCHMCRETVVKVFSAATPMQ